MLILRKVVSELSACLKVQGFNTQTHQQAIQILQICQTKRAMFFKNELEVYFNDLAQKQLMNPDLPPTLFCCSDVIESAFGKFKYKISPNSIGDITEFTLTIANFGRQFSKYEILKAMEAVKCEDLKKWRIENDVPSLAKKRRDVFSQKQNAKILPIWTAHLSPTAKAIKEFITDSFN